MGKLYVNGRAKQELNADMVNINLRYEVRDENSTRALYIVTEQCEQFLGKLKKAGFNLDQVRLADDEVSQDRYVEERLYIASRSVEFDMPFEIKNYNAILDMIRKEQYEINLSTNYYLSNNDEVKERLVQEAVVDSQKRAEQIAAALGRKLIGFKEMDVDGIRKRVNSIVLYDQSGSSMSYKSDLDNSNLISAPLIEKEEKVSVTWIIE